MAITGFILAGGKSSRMGFDKGFCKLDDTTFVELIYKELKHFCDEVILISDNEDYDVFGIKRIEDIIPNKGPVGGIYTALHYSTTKDNLIVSCDSPFVSADVLMLLANDYSGSEIVQLATVDRTMPLIAKYQKGIEKTLLKRIANNELKLQLVLKTLDTKTIVVTPNLKKHLININTMEDLNEVQ